MTEKEINAKIANVKRPIIILKDKNDRKRN